jgi:hypothetical protein
MAADLRLDEQEHGEDRTYRAEQLKLQHRADLKTTIALILSGIAILISIWAKYSAPKIDVGHAAVGYHVPQSRLH